MDFRDVILAVCLQWAPKTPVVIIVDDDKGYLQKKLQKSGLVAEALFKQSIVESNGSLTIFNKKQGLNYPVFLISEE